MDSVEALSRAVDTVARQQDWILVALPVFAVAMVGLAILLAWAVRSRVDAAERRILAELREEREAARTEARRVQAARVAAAMRARATLYGPEPDRDRESEGL